MPIQPEEDPGPSYTREESLEIEVGSSDPESDSDLDSSSDGERSIKSTRSCTSQNLPHVEENGRRYCDENYFMPNDETELSRLNIVHQIYLILFEGRLTLTTFNTDSPRILDIGTGPGDWAIEMSAEYPNATIVACDLGIFDSGIGHVSLPNVDFQLADAQSQWTYHEPFDLIHIRGLSGAFRDWHSIYQQAFAHLRPGGYIEIADTDPAGDTVAVTTNSDEGNINTPSLRTYASALRASGEISGYPRDLQHLRKESLLAVGFDNITVIEETFPVGLWPEDIHDKTLGKMALIALLEGLEAHALRPLTKLAGYTLEAAKELCEKVQEEVLAAEKITARVRIVTARRPISFEQRRDEVFARATARARILREGRGDL
ncbi:uncharacterized protein N7503_008115 [Penicillium pulvis]|uniref:uncharacterized protein n=1 Tax=Penicillium pulvis TaxID=1562058 RepID=UPI0025492A13|nr:uncharacterized protein N7503_008115 [Penicillium pulvis]KAJ5792137.1 hypothetical protein N7503_008115 [Penicillium pulvis]